jgi:hypothetical protein
MISENSIFKSGGKQFKDYSRKPKAPPKKEVSILPIEVDTPKKKSLYEKMKDYDFSTLKKIALSSLGVISAVALIILGVRYKIKSKRQLIQYIELDPEEIKEPVSFVIQPEEFSNYGNGMCGGNVFSDVYKKVSNMDSSTKKKIVGVAGLAGFIANALLNKNHKAPHGVPLFEGFGKNKNPKLFKTYEKKKIPVIDEEKATDKDVATTWDKVKTLGEQTLLQLAIAGIGLASTIATVILQKKIYEALGIPVEDITLEPIKLEIPKFGEGGQNYKNYSKPNKTLPNPILPPEINTPKKKSLFEKMKDYDFTTLKKVALGSIGVIATVALIILGIKYGIKNKKELRLENIPGLPPTDSLIYELQKDPLIKVYKPAYLDTPQTPLMKPRRLHEPALEYSGLGY